MSSAITPKRETPVDLGPVVGCAKCCSHKCDCIERGDGGDWNHDNCDWCRANSRAIAEGVDKVPATYRVIP